MPGLGVVTVTACVATAKPQASTTAYVIVAVPAAIPVTEPLVEPTVANDGSELLHVPPETEDDKLMLLPMATDEPPEIAPAVGSAFTVTMTVELQPEIMV